MLQIVNLVLRVINILILLRVVISWLAPYSRNDFVNMVYSLTEPLLKPFRILLPINSLQLDISPIIAYFFFNVVLKNLILLIFY